ncbi:Catenin alpha [Geodia barretti]|uniref:Catenin alpha n=1 Tax=Geodia barretti TaxID=519541 RepID=A0AA35T5G3_GEOBA|nr:Catenin alpha [Geodia barretti]
MAETSSSEEDTSPLSSARPSPEPPTTVETAGKKELETRTKAVEEALSPLIEQITRLSGDQKLDPTKPLPPSVERLAVVVQRATETLVSLGEQIASENPTFQEDLLLACNEVKVAGGSMQRATLDFSGDTLDAGRREAMAEASRALLIAVTRLLAVVDTIDSHTPSQTSIMMEAKLKTLYEVSSEAELMRTVRDCTPDITRLTQLAAQKFSEEGSEEKQQILAAAQTQLNQASRSLITSSKTFLNYPHMASAKANRDYVVSSMTEALVVIAELTDGRDASSTTFLTAVEERPGLYQYFDELESLLSVTVGMEPSGYTHHQTRLGTVLKRILAEAGDLLSLSFPHDYRQHSIITLSQTLKHGTRRLLLALGRGGRREEEEEEEGGGSAGDTVIGDIIIEVESTAQDLKKELTNAVMDQLSGAFLQPLVSVERVETGAKAGKETTVRKRLSSFKKHAADMEKAAQLVCSLSRDRYGVRTTQFVVKYISSLKSQVAYAAQTLCMHPASHLALRNMVLFREAWAENVQLLLSSLEALAPLTQFMSVVEVLIREDSGRFMKAVEGGDGREARRAVQTVKGRGQQLLRVVKEDLAGNPRAYSQEQLPGVKASAQTLADKSLQWFGNLGLKAADTVASTHNPHTVNQTALEEAAQKMNEDVWRLRRAVLQARGEYEGDSGTPTPSAISPYTLSQESVISLGGNMSPGGDKFERTPTYSGVFQEEVEEGGASQTVLEALSPGQREQLARETDTLSQEHSRFEDEVSRWSNSGHDIIIIAKEMCNMMMDMSNFTKGEGQLKTSMDVIITAKDIARAGEYLYKVTRPVAEKCPSSQHRDELLVHLDRMRLHTQQLKITSRVTLEQEGPPGETVDSASAMLSAGRNLMDSVVQVVKTCYLASSAIARIEGTVPEEVVQWRLQSPQLKQLTPEQSGAPPGNNRDTPSKTYREQRRAEPSPISQLEEFQSEPEVGGTGRRRKVTPVPAPTRGGRPRRPRGGGGGGGTDLEAIPEVASSHSLHETTFL